MADVSMRLLLSAQSGNTLGIIKQVIGALGGGGGLGGTLAMVGIAAAGAAVAIGVTAVNATSQFQTGLTTLVTGAGELQSNLGLVSQGILQTSIDTATSTQQLISGMFMIESAGYHGAAGLNVLKVAAEGAKTGNADLGTVANAVTTVMKDYNIAAGNSADAMNFLTGIVQNGKTTLQALSGSMSQVLPTASAVGVQLTDVGGALATMTGEGVNAAQASTYLRQMLISLAAPASAGAKSLKSIGLSSQEVSDDMKKSLPDTLKLIMQHLAATYTVGSPAYVTALKNIAGGSKQMQGMLDLTGTHLADFQSNVQNVAGVMDKGKGSVVGFGLVQQNLSFKMGQLGAAGNALLIVIGQALLPTITNIAGAVVPVISNFTKWLAQGNKLQNGLNAVGTVLKGIGGFIGGVVTGGEKLVGFFQHSQVATAALLIPLGMLSAVLVQMAVGAIVSAIAAIPGLVVSFGAWAVSAGAAAIATLAATWPVLAIGAAIGVLIAIIILLVTHWGAVTKFLQGVWHGFTSWFMSALHSIGTFFSQVWNNIASFFSGVWGRLVAFAKSHIVLIVGLVTGPLGALVAYVITHWSQIVAFFKGLWAKVVGAFDAAKSAVGSAITRLWNGIESIAKTWPGKALQWGKDLIQNLINGITNMVGNLKNAVGNVAKSIASFLHFSQPEVGPLSTINQWMPDMFATLQQGIQAGAPRLTMALNAGLAGAGPGAMVPSRGLAATGGGQNTTIHQHFHTTVSTAYPPTTQQIQQIVTDLEPELGRRVLQQTPGYSTGGWA